MDGWVKLHRAILSWEWYDDIPTTRLFLHLLLTVNHEDKLWRGYEVLKGERITSLSKLAKESHLSIQQVRTSIKRLKSTQELTQKQHSGFSHLKLNNWSRYQQTNTVANTELTRCQHGANTVLTTTKEGKKERKKEVSLEHVSTKKEEDVISSENNLPTSPVVSSSLPPTPPKYQPPSERKQMKGKDGRVLSVWLCREEYEILWKMCDDDETLLDYYINQLHDFAVANNRNYTSHFHELRTWIRRDKKNS